MTSNAFSAFGTLIQVGDGATPTENFTTIAEVRDISGPNFTSETIDITNHSSPSAVREFIASLIDPGELTFDINFLPTDSTHDDSTGLIADMLARTKRNFRIVWPDTGTTTWQITGIVTGFEITASIDDVLQASVTIKITALPNFSP